jgi:hypothetical protein
LGTELTAGISNFEANQTIRQREDTMLALPDGAFFAFLAFSPGSRAVFDYNSSLVALDDSFIAFTPY